jgi:excisionase family DNA binding protein
MAEVLYTVPEVAKILKTNVDYVHKLRKAGVLQFLKIGSYKCRESTLDKFLEDYEGWDVTDPEHARKLDERGA